MKKVLFASIFFLVGFSHLSAQDDVYDAPAPVKVRVAPPSNPSYNNQEDYTDDEYNYDLTYSNRLRRMYNSYSYNYTPYMAPMVMGGDYWGSPYGSSFSMSFGNSYGYNYNPYLYNNYWGMPSYGYGYYPYSNFYGGYGFNPYYGNGFYNDYYYRPYYGNYYPTYRNPYSNYNNGNRPGVYRNNNPRPNNNGNNNGYYNGNNNSNGGSYSPPPTQTTPRGFGRYDNTYRQSPAQPVPNYNPQQSNPGPQNQNNRGNSDYKPNINQNSGNSNPAPSRPANNSGGGAPRMNRF